MEIEQKYRTFWPRFGAALLDAAALAPVVWLDQLLWNNTTSGFVLSFWVLLQQAVYLSYYIGFLYIYGQTPGKMAMGVIVLDYKDRKLSFTQAILRNIVQVLVAPISLTIVLGNLFDGKIINRGLGDLEHIMWLGFAVIIWGALEMITMLFNRKRRAIHDFIAGTVVVRQSKEDRLSGFKELRYALIVLFIASLIVPRLLPEKNMTREGFDATPPNQSMPAEQPSAPDRPLAGR